MARIRIIYGQSGKKMAEFHDGVLVFSTEEYCSNQSSAPMIMPDIQPYKSMIDGQMIMSRSQHRSHLKQHGCIEVGNEVKHLKKHGEYNPQGQKQALIQTMRQKGLM